MPEPASLLIARAMRLAFPSDVTPGVSDYYARMEYHLGWRDQQFAEQAGDPGKLIRPRLAILACRALGGTTEQALPLAAGLQLLHDFSLIHDDIEDHSAQRRGRATVWALWGVEVGINIGDGMFAVAHRALYRLADAGVDPATVLAVLRGFEDTILRICEGQHLDITAEGRFDTTSERYLEMIAGKTAVLVAAATELGARLATSEEQSLVAMHDFGMALGMAFQVQDDLLDIWGDPALTGKPAAADLHSRKLSYPVILGLEQASAADRTTFERIYRKPDIDADDIPVLLAILERTAARDATEQLADRYHAAAVAALARMTIVDAEAFEELRQLAATLLHRRR